MSSETNNTAGVNRRALLGGTAKAAALAGLTGAVGGATASGIAGSALFGATEALAANAQAGHLNAEVKPGDLDIPDCRLAASQFMLTCQAGLFLPFVFQAAPAPSAERISEVADSAVRMFLAAYRAK